MRSGPQSSPSPYNILSDGGRPSHTLTSVAGGGHRNSPCWAVGATLAILSRVMTKSQGSSLCRAAAAWHSDHHHWLRQVQFGGGGKAGWWTTSFFPMLTQQLCWLRGVYAYFFAVMLFLILEREIHTKAGGLLIIPLDNHKTLPSTLSMLMIPDLIFLPSLHKPINRLISGLLLL